MNNLEKQAELVTKAWSNVEAVYQARARFASGIVSKLEAGGYVDKQRLASITALRDQTMEAMLSTDGLADKEAVAAFEAAQKELGNALTRLLTAIDGDSQLERSEEQRQLESFLVSSEYRISVAHSIYNDAVGNYNFAINTMPTSLLAGLFGHSARVTLDL